MDNGTRILRWLADAYEQAQRIRIETGERIRAVLQGRDETWSTNGNEDVDADFVLKEIKKGETDGPVPILGVTYRHHAALEKQYRKVMMETLNAHPAWPWLEKVKGIGETLACKMLARLDAEKAKHASSFYAYCGLATVPAHEYACTVCDLRQSYPVRFNVTGKHKSLNNGKQCKGLIELDRAYDEEKDTPRCAQPKPSRGEKSSYDQYAKKVMYLVATSFLKSGGPYERYYREKRGQLERERPFWPDGRKHNAALRKVEKLFLSHLWEVMRTAMDLPTSDPYPQAEMGHEGKIDPWKMVGK